MDNLENFINNTIHNNSLVKINDKLYLKQYQINLLELNHIPYQNCSSINEILLLLSDNYDDDLEELANSLQEFNYYHYTNK